MGRKTLIPEEKWEGLRHAMEEAGRVKSAARPTGEVVRKAADGKTVGKGKNLGEEKKRGKKGKIGRIGGKGKGKKNGGKKGKKGKKKGKKKK
jgi:hypothetical protein